MLIYCSPRRVLGLLAVLASHLPFLPTHEDVVRSATLIASPQDIHCPYPTTDRHMYSILRNLTNHNTMSFLKVRFSQYTLTTIVMKDSDLQKGKARESWPEEKIGVSESSRLLHHSCQRHFALIPLCPKYYSLTCSNPGGKHWNLCPRASKPTLPR